MEAHWRLLQLDPRVDYRSPERLVPSIDIDGRHLRALLAEAEMSVHFSANIGFVPANDQSQDNT
jgi:hypothetical protein